MPQQKRKEKHSAAKVGRADRPGPKNRRVRAYYHRLAHKKRVILHSNGKAFLEAWNAKRFAGGFARWHANEV